MPDIETPLATNTATVYEIRFGWSGRAVYLLALSVLFLFAPLLFSGDDKLLIDGFVTIPVWLFDVLSLSMGVIGTWHVLSLALRRPVQLRVDAAGVTFGSLPFRRAVAPVTVPWTEITAVDLWVQQNRKAKIRYVGLHRTPGARPLPAAIRRNESLTAGNADLAAKGEALLGCSRPVTLARFDLDRFRAAVGAHAPQVPVYQDPRFA